ncbi:MAG: hypothetical protein FWC09_03050 [Lachnospiraceae bacterium]|nr:hypothetical protein [Lachnospiraceae bacterium]
MKIEFEKTMLLSGELLSYCHKKGAKNYQLNITEEADAMLFTIKAFPTHISEEKLERLKNKLNTPRNREIEQDFWGLSGESESGSEMTLVGMMCDEAHIEYDCNELSIMIKRLEKHG